MLLCNFTSLGTGNLFLFHSSCCRRQWLDACLVRQLAVSRGCRLQISATNPDTYHWWCWPSAPVWTPSFSVCRLRRWQGAQDSEPNSSGRMMCPFCVHICHHSNQQDTHTDFHWSPAASCTFHCWHMCQVGRRTCSRSNAGTSDLYSSPTYSQQQTLHCLGSQQSRCQWWLESL